MLYPTSFSRLVYSGVRPQPLDGSLSNKRKELQIGDRESLRQDSSLCGHKKYSKKSLKNYAKN
jgi:hypothetical protein